MFEWPRSRYPSGYNDVYKEDSMDERTEKYEKDFELRGGLNPKPDTDNPYERSPESGPATIRLTDRNATKQPEAQFYYKSYIEEIIESHPLIDLPSRELRYLTITCASSGYENGNQVLICLEGNKILAKNNINFNTRGMHLITIDPFTQKVIKAQCYDQWGDWSESKKDAKDFVHALDEIKKGTIVAIANSDDGATNLRPEAIQILNSTMGSKEIDQL